MSRFIGFLKRDKKLIIISITVSLILTLCYTIYASAAYSARVQRGISQSILRLHVLPNSDDPDDQELKLRVRDGLLEFMQTFLTGGEDKATAIRLISENIPQLTETAQQIVYSHGFDYVVRLSFSSGRFPIRRYEHVTLPTGRYDALRVEIGSAAGNNWWCIAFPPLCFVDATQPRQPQPAPTLQNVLTAEQYSLIQTPNNARPQPRFFIVEFWQNLWR
jgi:stage II sporulation protein R